MRIKDGRRYPFIEGNRKRTPFETLNLQPGELVRVKSKEEIVKTLDTHNANRGMSFDGEMVRYCGREARVLRRVEQIIDEKSGRMTRFKNPCIVLEDVTCTGAYHPPVPPRHLPVLARDLAGAGRVSRRRLSSPCAAPRPSRP